MTEQLSRTAFPDDVRARLVGDAQEVIARYPRSRSAACSMIFSDSHISLRRIRNRP